LSKKIVIKAFITSFIALKFIDEAS